MWTVLRWASFLNSCCSTNVVTIRRRLRHSLRRGTLNVKQSINQPKVYVDDDALVVVFNDIRISNIYQSWCSREVKKCFSKVQFRFLTI